MEWRNKLSVLVCRYFFDGFVGKREFKEGNISREAYVYESDFIMGVSTSWGDLLLNSQLFNDNFEELDSYVFLHEIGHMQLPWLRNIGGLFQLILYRKPLILGILIISALMANSYLYPSSPILLNAVESQNLALSMLLIYTVGVLSSYSSELSAELFAVEKMGKERFLKASEEGDEILSDMNYLDRIAMRASHPPHWMVLRAYERLNQ